MLNALDDQKFSAPIEGDVVLIGAGLVGLVLAEKLVHFGMTVVVLESGDNKQVKPRHPLNEVIMTTDYYSGALDGRFRCLGGTSTRWGGAMLPFLESDFGSHSAGWHDGWPIDAIEINSYVRDVERIFGLAEGAYEELGGHSLNSFVKRSPKWPTFRKRSTSGLYNKLIKKNKKIQVITNATVTELLHENGVIQGVKAESSNGKKIRVTSPRVVITAGAIETTRILMLAFKSRDDFQTPGLKYLGSHFHDHISAPIAKFDVKDVKSMVRLFGFNFCKGGMRNIRFELSPCVRNNLSLPGGFLHVSFSRPHETAFDGLRQIYQSLQRREVPQPSDLGLIFRDLPWLVKAIWWRIYEKKVLPPNGSSIELHLVIEQVPEARNKFTLSNRCFDRFGQPLLEIDWKLGKEDLKNFSRIAEISIQDWNGGGFEKIAHAHALPSRHIKDLLAQGGGVFHPAGTTRIGADETRGVLDKNLKVFGFNGLWAISTAMFPNVGSGNPSLALLQFGIRAAKNIYNHKNV